MIGKAEIGRLYWDLNSLSQIRSSREAVKEFEAYLFHTFLKEAFKDSSSLFGNSFQGKFFKDMFTMELSQEIADTDPLKLAGFFEEAIKRYKSIGGK